MYVVTFSIGFSLQAMFSQNGQCCAKSHWARDIGQAILSQLEQFFVYFENVLTTETECETASKTPSKHPL